MEKHKVTLTKEDANSVVIQELVRATAKLDEIGRKARKARRAFWVGWIVGTIGTLAILLAMRYFA